LGKCATTSTCNAEETVMIKFLLSTAGVIFLIGLLVVIGVLNLIF
jgi:hypothetical protein